MNVDTLAQIIRRVDGDNTMGAGGLAEAIVAALDLTSEGEAAEPAPITQEAADAWITGKGPDPRTLTVPQPAQPDLEVVATVDFSPLLGVNWVKPTKAVKLPQGASLVLYDDAQAHIAALTAKMEELDGECQQSMLTICRERDRAETAEARVAQLEEALEPFAKEADRIEDLVPSVADDMILYPSQNVSVGEFRRARAALGGQSNG